MEWKGIHMTLPDQPAHAIELAGDILRDLGGDLVHGMCRPKRMEYLERVKHVLRHHPDAMSIRAGAQRTAYCAAQQKMEPWVAPSDVWRQSASQTQTD
jgi:hypothetical protein